MCVWGGGGGEYFVGEGDHENFSATKWGGLWKLADLKRWRDYQNVFVPCCSCMGVGSTSIFHTRVDQGFAEINIPLFVIWSHRRNKRSRLAVDVVLFVLLCCLTNSTTILTMSGNCFMSGDCPPFSLLPDWRFVSITSTSSGSSVSSPSLFSSSSGDSRYSNAPGT